MPPRLRSMTVDADRTILVLDKSDDFAPWVDRAPALAEGLQRIAERIGLAGAVVFACEIELPDDDLSDGVQ